MKSSIIETVAVGVATLLVTWALVDSGLGYIAVAVAFTMGGIAALIMVQR